MDKKFNYDCDTCGATECEDCPVKEVESELTGEAE